MEWRTGANSSRGLRSPGLLEAAGDGRQPALRRGARPLSNSPLPSHAQRRAPVGKRGTRFCSSPRLQIYLTSSQ